jgi:hypothetical protein
MGNIEDEAFFIEALARRLKSRGLTDSQVVDVVADQFNPCSRIEIEQLLRLKQIIR